MDLRKLRKNIADKQQLQEQLHQQLQKLTKEVQDLQEQVICMQKKKEELIEKRSFLQKELAYSSLNSSDEETALECQREVPELLPEVEERECQPKTQQKDSSSHKQTTIAIEHGEGNTTDKEALPFAETSHGKENKRTANTAELLESGEESPAEKVCVTKKRVAKKSKDSRKVDSKKFKNSGCAKDMKSRQSQQLHEKRDSEMAETPTIPCDLCNRKFESKQDLKVHKDGYHGGKANLTCYHCRQTFETVTGLNKHMDVHQGGNCYLCPVCDESLDSAASLNVHVNKHNNSTPFVCDKCGNGYYNEASLTKHIKTSCRQQLNFAEIRPEYSCKICGKIFTSLDSLKDHKRGIHSDVKIHCEQCGDEFKWRSQLSRHKLVCGQPVELQ